MAEHITFLTNYHKEKENLIQRGVHTGAITLVVSDTATTSSCAPTNVPLQKTGIKSNKVFIVAVGDVAPESEKSELTYDVRGDSK